jgi:hypothetical protein
MKGGTDCRIGIMNPTYGGKRNRKTRKQKGKGCGCDGSPAPKMPFMALPSEASMGPLTAALYKGGFNCPCALAPQIHTPMGGGYRPTKRNLKYLKLWKQGKSIGFTMRSSLKAKGLIPRANGTKRVSPKYSF